MTIKCEYCGEIVEDLKFVYSRSKKAYCSKHCLVMSSRTKPFLPSFFLLLFTLFIILFPYYMTGKDLSTLIVVSFAGVISLILAIIFAIGGYRVSRYKKKHSSLEDSGELSLSEKSKGLSEITTFSCYHCGKNISLTEATETRICMSCGNKLPYCDLCKNFIRFKDEVLRVELCGHIFHKDELLKWMEENDSCPKCYKKIELIDTDPE